MYIKKSVVALKMKNIVFNVIGVFLIASSVFVLMSLFATYHDDMYTFFHAKATPECVNDIILGVIFLVIAHVSGRNIGDAYFYSNYFELDLDGRITYRDLAESCGKDEKKLVGQMKKFRRWYMQNFELDEDKAIVLNSKICECECRSCGAPIEKRMYFAGKCSYCGGSDVFAKVLTDNRIYSISIDQSAETGSRSYYLKKNLEQRRSLAIVMIAVAAVFVIISMCGILDQSLNLNNKEYLTEKLLAGEGASFELIREGMIDLMLFFGMLIIAMVPLVIGQLGMISKIDIAKKCAEVFAKAKEPFVRKTELPAIRKPINGVCRVIRQGYAKNCSIECVEGEFRVSLAKKILKDKCPYCGAHIVDVRNEQYTCPYCQRAVMGVVEKK